MVANTNTSHPQQASPTDVPDVPITSGLVQPSWLAQQRNTLAEALRFGQK